MAEVKREPIKIVVDGAVYYAFDDNHSISDIIRYAASCADLGEVQTLVKVMIDGGQEADAQVQSAEQRD